MFWNMLRSPFIGAVIMYAIVMGWRFIANQQGLPLLLTLVVSVMIGAVVYAGVIWLLEEESLLEARDVIVSMIRNRREKSEGDLEVEDA
jgi:hypothetical protein